MSDGRITHAERIGEPGAIIRDGRDGGVEMVNLIWGLEPTNSEGRPFEVVRAEGRTFPNNRCLVPAFEFFHMRRGRCYRFTRVDGDWFYLAGIWRPATPRWPSAYAVLTVEANADVQRYVERQMVVLPRDERVDWLSASGTALFCAPPDRTFAVELWEDGNELH